MFIPALVSHCELSKWAGPEVGYLFLEQQPRQRTDVWRRRNKRPKSEGTAGEEKKEMRGREEEKKQRLSAFGSVICSLQIKWAGRALNLPRVCRQSSSIKGSHLLLRCSWHCCCSSGSSQGCTWGTMEKLFCLLFQSNT